MGFFSSLLGMAASQAQQPDDVQERFERLKIRFESALNTANTQHILFQSIQVMDDRLFVKGTAPSQEAKELFWDKVKATDPEGKNIIAQIEVAGSNQDDSVTGKAYIVKSGDTLSKISKQFYGDPSEYMKIFYANRDVIDNPLRIQEGQKIRIPYE